MCQMTAKPQIEAKKGADHAGRRVLRHFDRADNRVLDQLVLLDRGRLRVQ
jgi:hypothetical protein